LETQGSAQLVSVTAASSSNQSRRWWSARGRL